MPDNLSSTLVPHVRKRELMAQVVLLLTHVIWHACTHTENDRLPINTYAQLFWLFSDYVTGRTG